MSLIKHAEREFAALGWPGDCPMQKEVCKNLLKLLRVFAAQGHSGTSAPYTLALFAKLAAFKPIGPLTGADSEWVLVSPGLYQNNRCGSVFKENGIAYNIDGIVWKDKHGCFTNKDSRVRIHSFPYTPKTVYRKAQ